MTDFLTAVNAWPTVIYSGLLIVVVLYWLLALIGQVGLDSLDMDAGGDADVDAGVHGFGIAGVLEWLAVGKVPLSLILSTWSVYGWMLAMNAEYLLRPTIGSTVPSWVYALLIALIVAVAALFLTAWTMRPVSRLFTVADATQNANLVGRVVTITSRSVDPTFGRAVAIVTGSEVVLDVICRDDHALKRDDQAVVVEYLNERNLYLVAPLRHLANTDAAAAEPAIPDPAPQEAETERRDPRTKATELP